MHVILVKFNRLGYILLGALDDDSAAQSKAAVDPRQQPGAQHGSKPKQIAIQSAT